MLFHSILNALWEGITSQFFPRAATTTATPPPEDMDIDFGASNGEFSSVGCPHVFEPSGVAPMPGTYYPDLSADSTSSAGPPGNGLCASSASASPSPITGREGEVELDGNSEFSGYSTPPSWFYSSYGRPEPVTTYRRTPTSSFPRRSEKYNFTPSTNAKYSRSGLPGRDRPPEPIPCSYPTLASSGYSGYGYFAPSTNSSYPSPPHSSPLSSPPPSSLFTYPAASDSLSNTQANTNIRPPSNGEPKFNSLGSNMPEASPGNLRHSEFVRNRVLENHISKLRRRLLFLKIRELRQGLSDKLMHHIALTEHLLDSELRSGKIALENEPEGYASKRPLDLDADGEVGAAEGATGIEPRRIPARKKARPAGQHPNSKTTARATASARGTTRVPPAMTPRTYSTGMVARAEGLDSPPAPPPGHVTPITPTRLGDPNPGDPRSLPQIPPRMKRAQAQDAAIVPTNKKPKIDCVSPHSSTPKRGRRQALNRKPLHPRAPPALPKSSPPQSVKSSRTGLAKGVPMGPHGEATPFRKRTNENVMVKSATTKNPRKEYFSEGMIPEYESDSDSETVDKNPDKKKAQSAIPPARYTFTTSTTTPTNVATSKPPFASILGKRTSSITAGFGERYTGNKKGRKEYFQEGMILEFESDEVEPVSYRDNENSSTREADCGNPGYYPPRSSARVQSVFAARVEEAVDEDEVL